MLESLLDLAILLVIIGLLLQWAERLLRPLLPELIVLGVGIVVLRILHERRRYR